VGFSEGRCGVNPFPDMTTKALAGWYGSARLVADHIGLALDGCAHVTIPFAGGMCEVARIKARSIVVSDLHCHIVNLAMTVADPVLGPKLYRAARRMPLHETILAAAQKRCKTRETRGSTGASLFGDANIATPEMPNLDWALDYWICSWMGRGGQAGQPNEFDGGMSHRMDAGGGDSAKRFASATMSLMAWRRAFYPRCSFLCCDAFDLLPTVKDEPECGVYSDSPWAGKPGEIYKHAFDELKHRKLAGELSRFKHARVVIRYGVHPLVEELYPRDCWEWTIRAGRDRANQAKAEALIISRRAV
jgi:DNA adenine methylase